MRVLLDTNILVRLADQGSPHHAEATRAVERLDAADETCVIVPQVLYEYWVVATRPADRNGLGLSTASTALALERWTTLFQLLRDERGIYSHWEDLVRTHGVSGKNAHDARLVAAMQRHGVTDLLTFNSADFSRYPGIRVWTPAEIIAGQFPSQSGQTR